MKLRITYLQIIYKCVLYAMIVLMVLCTGGIWFRMESYTKLSKAKRIIAILEVLVIIIEAIKKKGKTSHSYFKILMFLTITFLFSSIANIAYFGDAFIYIYIPMIVFFSLGVGESTSELYKMYSFYINVMTIIATSSLLFYLFGSLLHIISPTERVSFLWGDTEMLASSYRGLFYEPDIYGSFGSKNCAIFTEAPMYSFLLTTAYTLSRTYVKKHPIINTLLVITIFTTLSTTGIITVLIFESICFLRKRNRHKIIKILRMIFLPFVIIAAGYISYTFFEAKALTGSYGVRQDHLVNCIKVFIDTFPFGCGVGNSDAILSSAFYKQGLSVGLPYFFAQGGLATVILFFVPFSLYLIAAIRDKDYYKIAFSISYFWVMFCTNLTINSFLYWMPHMCVLGREMYEENNKRHHMRRFFVSA